MGQIQRQRVNRERDDQARQRAASVYRLWLRGYSWSRIAREVGYSNESGAYKAWQRAKRDQAAPPDVEEERLRERERLETAYASIAERVEAGDVWAIDRAIALAARKATLLGLDAAKQPTDATPYTVVQEAYPAPWVDALKALAAPTSAPTPTPTEGGAS